MKQRILLLSSLQISLILFVLSSFVILFFWHLLPGGFQDIEASDYLSYYKPLAFNIIQGKGLVMNEQWMTRYPPGFPVLLASFLGLSTLLDIQPILLVALMILLFSAGSSVLMFFLGKLVWGEVGGIICSLLWMTYPFHVWLTKSPNSELPFIFFLLLSVLFLLLGSSRSSSLIFLVLVGISIGIAMLIRPIAIGFSIILAVTYWLISKGSNNIRFAGFFLILLGSILAISPWEYATYLHTGKIIPLSSLGSASLRLGFTFPVKLDGFRQPVNVPDDVNILAQEILYESQTVLTTGEQAAIIFNHFRKTPISFLKFIIIKLGRTWYGTDTNKYDRYILIVQIFYLILFSLSAYLTARKTNKGKLLFPIMIPSLLYFWSITVIGMPLLRYMVPAIALLFLLVPACVQYLPLTLPAHKESV